MKIYILLIIYSLLIISKAQYFANNNTDISSGSLSFDTTNPQKCLCDMTQNSCDIYCCCDTQCTEANINSWFQGGLCIIQRTSGSFCIKSLYLSSYRIKKGIFVTKYPQSGQDDICFQVENRKNDKTLVGFIDPPDNTTSFALLSQNNIFATSLYNLNANNGQYSINSKILSSSSSYFIIPTPDFFGNCQSLRALQFDVNINNISCIVYLPTIQGSCSASSTYLSLSSYLSSYISDGSSQSTSIKTPTISSAQKLNSDGTLTTLQLTSPYPIPTLTTSNSQCICSSVVKEVDYLVLISSSTITSISAAVTLQDITAQCTSSVYTIVKTSVKFANNIQAATNNIVPNNPGFYFNDPFRVGQQTTFQSVNAINLLGNPYSITGILSDGSCATKTTTSSSMQNRYMYFGQSMQLTCKYSLQSSTLSTICTNTFLNALPLYQNFIPSTTYIPIYGNSDPNYIQDWMLIQGNNQATATYSDSEGTCIMPTSAQLTLIYSYIGDIYEPQYYIAQGDFYYGNPIKIQNTADLTSINFNLNIKFRNADQLYIDHTPKSYPSFLPMFPPDLFYPIFYFSASMILEISSYMAFLMLICLIVA